MITTDQSEKISFICVICVLKIIVYEYLHLRLSVLSAHAP